MTAKIGGVLLVAVLAAGCAFAYVNEDCDWRDRSEAREIAREAVGEAKGHLENLQELQSAASAHA